MRHLRQLLVNRFTFACLMWLLANGGSMAQAPDYNSVLPAGYQLKDVNKEDGPSLRADFDQDGLADWAVVYTKKDFNDARLVVYLSSQFTHSGMYQYATWFHMVTDMRFEMGRLVISSTDMGRYTSDLQLKFDPALKKMKVVKYLEDGVNKTTSFSWLTWKRVK